MAAPSPAITDGDTTRASSWASGALMPVRPVIAGLAGPGDLSAALRDAQYLAGEELATAAYLALALGKPLLLEGAPGVGKTEGAKAISSILGRQLVRLQCYEGIDAAAALWHRSTLSFLGFYAKANQGDRRHQDSSAPELWRLGSQVFIACSHAHPFDR